MLLAAALTLLALTDTTSCTAPGPWPTQKWDAARPEQAGVDPTRIATAFRRADSIRAVTGLVVVRHGRIVAEKYFHGGSRNEARHVASITKSVTALLAGIALERKLFDSLDQRLVDFVPQWAPAETDPASDIRLRQLLTMTSGLDDDWWRFRPTRLRARERPGTAFHYSNQGVQLVVRALHSAAKQPVPALAREALFAPLGLAVAAEPERWPVVDKFGNADGAGGLLLTARELAKLGLLVLREGCWDGTEVVPAAWMRAATTSQIRTERGAQYGYLFWITTVAGHLVPHMAGHGGQFVAIVPDLDLVVVLTADRDADGDGSRHFSIIRDDVIPAVNPD
jgi:CubicO group peptidase (beta-lactamase class C family)